MNEGPNYSAECKRLWLTFARSQFAQEIARNRMTSFFEKPSTIRYHSAAKRSRSRNIAEAVGEAGLQWAIAELR